jgi:hypothetical protein
MKNFILIPLLLVFNFAFTRANTVMPHDSVSKIKYVNGSYIYVYQDALYRSFYINTKYLHPIRYSRATFTEYTEINKTLALGMGISCWKIIDNFTFNINYSISSESIYYEITVAPTDEVDYIYDLTQEMSFHTIGGKLGYRYVIIEQKPKAIGHPHANLLFSLGLNANTINTTYKNDNSHWSSTKSGYTSKLVITPADNNITYYFPTASIHLQLGVGRFSGLVGVELTRLQLPSFDLVEPRLLQISCSMGVGFML